ncbi:hypothetical protein M406DRAFT_247508 [Cryphonectria parasitica EP155]|uniref:ZW10 C-terminal helical domain-containing protein n=1 Tax=Cryphonectria parasitica (strain ATCC 38755 / EP155) TaxID=660469 RepID=A0A9P4YCV6_CRYP1|nr:uncharacterized protein M406DRAFT_247508 [Cryphonectria parasitica EP155]KAF3771028.1 hypothetical protein M406DRAFT_247508 [Cryphonectria parasitica EP155]
MPGALGQALVNFTTSGTFPEEDASALKLSSEALPQAIEALSQAKSTLEAEIHTINEQTELDVATWKANAASLQSDILRSRQTANDILRQASEPAVSGEATLEAEEKVAFLQAELAYNTRVRQALASIKNVSGLLDQAGQACGERRILDALGLLETAWEALDTLPVGKGVRVVRLLDLRALELKNTVHEVFEHVWQGLVHVDMERRTVSVRETMEGEAMNLSNAATGLKAYKEVDQRMAQLWHEIDQAIVAPRMDVSSEALPAVVIDGDALRTEGPADRSIDALFADMDTVLSYFSQRLPTDLIDSLSTLMMPDIASRIISLWLDPAVPASLKEMDYFESIMAVAKRFCMRLTELRLSGFNELQEWVDDAPKVWLAKCRETALDTVRNRLSGGLGSSKKVERVEKQMVSRAEGQELAAAPATAAAAAAEDDDWGAWDDEGDQQDAAPQETKEEAPKSAEGEDEDGADAWGAWGDEGESQETAEPETPALKQGEGNGGNDDDDEGGAAWGWGDDDTQAEPQSAPVARQPASATTPAERQREMTLKETYNISSMPEPVLQLIFAILEDGAILTQTEHQGSPVAKAAAGLFALPTLALAMFRAVGPYYYALDIGGNMFLYNDTTYLAEKLSEFAASWKAREDLSTQAQRSLRLDNDIKMLQSFAARAYSNEMNIQKTVLRDLLGGEQSLLMQDDTDSCVDAATTRVRSLALTWETILARSAWYQAVGSLVDALSLKIISDVMEAPSIGQEDAYNIAKLIASVTELDDLFVPGRRKAGGEEEQHAAPQTMQYAPSWMRLKYLSEVLQSNLRDVRFLWMDSELSLFFTVDEVVDLINLSFEDNARTREVLKEITGHPHPRQEEHEGW